VGSCFYFDLPLSPLLTPPQASTSIENNQSEDSVDTSTAKSPLILLAEDNEANRMTISNYLEAKGYRLLIATNGQQAVELARHESPDIILMDIQMPDTDGLETMRQLRHCSTLATVPIIALTALAMEGDRDRCIQAGASEYFSKPVRLKVLLETIQHQLGSRD
jgi:CheY-like chemotaxis protein